jgi:hypothetical protein
VSSQRQPTGSAKLALLALAGGRCSFEGCNEPLVMEPEESAAHPQWVGQFGHIHAFRDGGARADPSLSPEERRDPGNFILLCQPHHTLVDGQETSFPAEMLRSMKRAHERWVRGWKTRSTERLRDVLSEAGGWSPRIGALPGRVSEVKELMGLLRPAHNLLVLGPPDSGKTELIRHVLALPAGLSHLDRADSVRGGKPVGLYVDVSGYAGEYRVLRALLHQAYKVPPALDLEDVDWDDPSRAKRTRGRMFALLDEEIGPRPPVFVIDGVEAALQREQAEADLSAIQELATTRAGVVVLVSQRRSPLPPRPVGLRPPSIDLAEIDSATACDLLIAWADDEGLLLPLQTAAAAISTLESIDGDDDQRVLLLPGMLKRGWELALHRVIRSGVTLDADMITDCVLQALGPFALDVLDGIGLGLRQEGALTATGLALFAWALLGHPDNALDADRARAVTENRWGGVIDGVFTLARSIDRGICDEAIRTLGAASVEGRRLDAAVIELIESIESGDLALRASAAEVLEASLSRLEANDAAAKADCVLRIREALLVLTAGQILLPVDPERVAEHSDATPAQRVSWALAQAYDGDDADIAEQSFTHAASAIDSRPELLHLLKPLDIAGAIIVRRFHAAGRRVQVDRTRVLQGFEARDPADDPYALQLASWAVNTVELGMDEGVDRNVLSGLLAFARARLVTPEDRPHEDVDEIVTVVRFCWAVARSSEADVALTELRNAVAISASAVDSLGRSTRLSLLYLRACRRLLNELADDDARTALAFEALANITAWHSPHVPIGILGRTAALVRRAGTRAVDVRSAQPLLMAAIGLLEPRAQDLMIAAKVGDSEPLLLLARAHESLEKVASQLADDATELMARTRADELLAEILGVCPRAEAWTRVLQRLDESSPPARQGIGLSMELRAAIEGAEQWLTADGGTGETEARLALWLTERKWRTEGSLARMLTRARADHPGTQSDARRLLARFRARREATLARLESTFGARPEIAISRAANVRQALQVSQHFSDATQPFEHLVEMWDGIQRDWPQLEWVALERLRFLRTVWAYRRVVEDGLRLANYARSGSIRRDASIVAASALVSAAAFQEDLLLADGTALDRDAMLQRAGELVSPLRDFRFVEAEALYLLMRIAVETNDSEHYDQLDTVSELLLGEDWLKATSDHFDAIAVTMKERGRDFASITIQGFTDPERLRGLGSVFLRRGELAWADTKSDYASAIQAFAMSEEFERSWWGNVNPVTAYLTGRAILKAVIETRSFVLDHWPFGDRTPLAIAQSRLDSAHSRSVGGFGQLVEEAQELAKTLTSAQARGDPPR